MNRNNSKGGGSKRLIIFLALISAVIIIASLFYFTNRGAGTADSGEPAPGETPAGSDARSMSTGDLEEAQKSAARAAITGKPVSGRVTRRPDYVSAIEWEVFQNVVGSQSGSDDTQMATLVNKLLFFKKKEAWESSGASAAERGELARDLLEMLPFMNEGGHINPDEARRLESSLGNQPGKAAH